MKTLSVGQCCSINDSTLQPCLKDNVEIVVFGKGVGECVLIKTATNKIIIVDSFINIETGNPVALDYLNKIGLSFDNICCVVLTHFHDDHIKGTFDILEKTNFKVDLVVNPIFRSKHLLSEISNKSVVDMEKNLSGISEITKLLSKMISFKEASFNKTIFVDSDDKSFSIVSLSPHDKELFNFLDSLSIEEKNSIIENYGSDKENIYSVVLLVKTNRGCFLLGGDYLNKQGNICEGWKLLAEEYSKMFDCKSFIFKIPHHGSKSAFNEMVWSNMVTEKPVSVTSIYNRGKKVPTDEEIEWVCNKSSSYFLNGGTKSDSDLERIFRKTIGTTKVLFKDGKLGFTRFVINPLGKIEIIDCVGCVEKVIIDANK